MPDEILTKATQYKAACIISKRIIPNRLYDRYDLTQEAWLLLNRRIGESISGAIHLARLDLIRKIYGRKTRSKNETSRKVDQRWYEQSASLYSNLRPCDWIWSKANGGTILESVRLVDHSLSQLEADELLQSILGSLPEKEHEVLEAIILGCSADEIATAEQTTQNAIYLRLNRARKLARLYLATLADD